MAEDAAARLSSASSRTHFPLPSYTPSLSPSLATPHRRRSAPDTLQRPPVRQGFHRTSQTQIPLSALCSLRAHPGKMGGDFCSASKFKCVPLPQLFSRHIFTPSTLKTVSLHGQRYTPARSTPQHTPSSLVSYSRLSMPNETLSRQRHHHVEREVSMNRTRSLQRAREVVPHRLHWAFYMNGLPADLASKDDMSEEEFQLLQKLTLSHNPALYYGTGIKSGQGQQLKEVARFERRVLKALRQHTTRPTSSIMEDGAGLEPDEHLVDSLGGRYSRLSRTITPGSPILERDEPPPPSSLSHDTFITETHSTQPHHSHH